MIFAIYSRGRLGKFALGDEGYYSPNPSVPWGLGLMISKYRRERQKDDSSHKYVEIQF